MWGSAVRVCPGLPRAGGLAQLARAPALQAGGQGFDSLILHMPLWGGGSLTGWKERHEKTQSSTAAPGIGAATLKTSRARILEGPAAERRRTGAVRDKYHRAHGGCLGSRRRRRTREAAKGRGEARTASDPRVSEWGNPPQATAASTDGGGEPAELKHLSRRRRGEQQLLPE